MRDSFAYESNASLLSKILVPDPIHRDTWDRAVDEWEANGSGESLLAWLLLQGHVEEIALLEAMETATGAPLFRSRMGRNLMPRPPHADLLERQGFLYLGHDGQRHLVAGGESLSPFLRQLLGPAAGEWEWVLVHPLRSGKGYQPQRNRPPQAHGEKQQTTHWLEELIQGLASQGATDIHFERSGESLRVRYHAGRRMQLAGQWTGERARLAMPFLKARAGLAASARALPLDGFISIAGGRQPLRARLSHITTVDGESLVLRIPARGISVLPLRKLGLPAELVRECMDTVLHDPGLLLCCGPTGSGKTTTLYGLLHELSGRELKILTIEDPVEQTLPGIVQSPVNDAVNWGFATAVRAYLRQDPDVIMIGEIRDAASAAAACRAALSGHCVVSSLHARNTEAALHRMLAWGVGAAVLADSVRLVINQRLRENQARTGLQPDFTWQGFTPAALYRKLEEASPVPAQVAAGL